MIVVGNNERVNQAGEVMYQAPTGDAALDAAASRPGARIAACTRDANPVEHLTGLRVGNMGAIEGWPAGAPELHLRVLRGRDGVLVEGQPLEIIFGGSEGTRWEPRRRRDVNERWWDINDRLFLWTTNHGDAVFYEWYEHDPSVIRELPLEFKFKGLTLKTTLMFPEMDEDIGIFPVEKGDCWQGVEFGNDLMRFRISSI